MMGKPTQTIFHADIKFVELKAEVKPPYLNIVRSFDLYTWLGIVLSYFLVCLCHHIIMWLGHQETNTVCFFKTGSNWLLTYFYPNTGFAL